MRSVFWRMAPVLLVAALSIDGACVWARTPVLPIPTPRQPSSVMAPKSGVPKSSIKAPNTKSAKKRTWFPFGNRNKK